MLKLLQFLFGIISVLCLIVWWRRRPLRNFASKIPGLSELPLIGNLHHFFGLKPEDFYSRVASITNGFETSFKVWLGPFLILILRDANDLKTVLASEECFDKIGFLYKLFFKHGLFVLEGDEYKFHRKVINPLFNPAAMKSYLPIINNKVKSFMSRFDERLKPDDEIEFCRLATDFSMDAMLATMFGIDHDDEDARSKFLDSVEIVIRITSMKVVNFWLMIEPIFKFSKHYPPYQYSRAQLNNFFDSLMENNEREYQQKSNSSDRVPRPYLDKLYEVRDTMTYEETRESVYAFFGAGFDTSGKAIPCVLFLLALNQKAQDKVVQEMKNIFGSDPGQVDEECLGKMKYLDLVIKESLRLLPIAIFLAREAKKDIKLTNYTVPAGTLLVGVIKETHTDKKYWGNDANEFRPERFSDDINTNAYLPFSKGTRTCPGNRYSIMVMKAFLSMFLMKYRVTTEMKYEELRIEFMFTMHVKQGFMLKIDRR